MCWLTLDGCVSDRSTEEDNLTSHTDTNIDLSLFGVHMGEYRDSLLIHIPNLHEVQLDSIYYYHLPYDTEDAQIFEDLEIALYSVDTTFIVNHKGYEHRRNGSPMQFPLEKTKHYAKLCFMIKNNKVLQGEILIAHPIIGYKNVDLSIYNFVGAIRKMYNDKYQTPDSIIMYNKVTHQAAFIGYDEENDIKNKIFDQLGGTYVNNNVHEEDVWVWKNAKIQADWDFLCHDIRIRYLDMDAIKQEKDKLLQNLENERQDSIKRIQRKQLEDIDSYNTQDI